MFLFSNNGFLQAANDSLRICEIALGTFYISILNENHLFVAHMSEGTIVDMRKKKRKLKKITINKGSFFH